MRNESQPDIASWPAIAAKTHSLWSSDTAILTYIALATVIAHVLTGNRYGFHRDELATLDDARHLAWGYIAYPPITPFFARVSLTLFGTSLAGFRFFAAIAEAAAVILTGLMARAMGARRTGQVIAALAAVPFCMAGGALMQYVSFDYFFWVLAAYSMVRLLQTENPRWWLVIGGAIGLGMESKYTMAFLVAGIVAAVLFTEARRYLTGKWLWYGVAISLLIFLPNLIWQVQHHFVSLEFLQTIHARDIRIGRTSNFLPGQINLMLLALPLAATGLYFCLYSREGRRYRPLAWMYLIPLALFFIFKARIYYMGPAYPMLYAAGCVWGERWLSSLKTGFSRTIKVLAYTALSFDILLVSAFTLPIAPINSRAWGITSKLNGDYRDEIGWPEIVQTLAQIRDSLPESERARTAVLAGNYGEAGAINLFGPQYGLPPAISGGNSFWAHGYGDVPPETVIVVGFSRQFVERNFSTCRLVATIWNQYGVETEETQSHPEIYVCRGLKQSWPDFWKNFQYFG